MNVGCVHKVMALLSSLTVLNETQKKEKKAMEVHLCVCSLV
jgi:hypothetical protein